MKRIALLPILLLVVLQNTRAQNILPDSLLLNGTLKDCIDYALKHQPLIRQSLIDEQITEIQIKTKLADWYPQINLAYNIQHYLELPTSFIPDANGQKRPVQTGSINGSNFQFTVQQSIFDRSLSLASRTARDIRKQSQQATINNKINVVTEVSKAFYDVLLTRQQVNVLDENIVRLERGLKDAYNQYQGGIVDKTDYKRAQIALNNTQADRKRTVDQIDSKYSLLKQLMGYPYNKPISIIYDSLQMEKDAYFDTLQTAQYSNRIEYQLLQTQKNLLQANLRYNQLSYLPTVSAFGNYIPSFQNDKFTSLYGSGYPSSVIGLQLALPIFQGNKRHYNIQNATLELNRLDLDFETLGNRIETEFAQARANYKGSLAQYIALKENLALAEDVYNTLRLQYTAGIKTYLDVIIAETDLRASQLNYLNALYALLSGKLDLEKALGIVKY